MKPYFSQQKTFLSNHVDHFHKLKTKYTPEKAKIYETSFNSFCLLLENKAEQLCYRKQLKTIYGHSIRRAFVEIGTYCGGEFHGPSGLFHSF